MLHIAQQSVRIMTTLLDHSHALAKYSIAQPTRSHTVKSNKYMYVGTAHHLIWFTRPKGSQDLRVLWGCTYVEHSNFPKLEELLSYAACVHCTCLATFTMKCRAAEVL